jgi:hypothetical protein
MYMESDFYGITNASEERDYHARMEALADARDAAREAERREEIIACEAADREEAALLIAEEGARFQAALKAAGARQYTDDSWMRSAPLLAGVATGGRKTRRAA